MNHASLNAEDQKEYFNIEVLGCTVDKDVCAASLLRESEIGWTQLNIITSGQSNCVILSG